MQSLQTTAYQNLVLNKMILPKKIDITKAQADERKREIDNGMALAHQVDDLRKTFQQEKLTHENWRKASIDELNNTLTKLDLDIQSKKGELVQIQEQRQELLKPLDVEWSVLNQEKVKIGEDRKHVMLDKESLKVNISKIKDDTDKIAEIITKVKRNEKDTEKAKSRASSLEEMAQREYEIARNERTEQNNIWEKKIIDINQKEKEYEVALQTIEIREQQVKDKESELAERELLLKDQYETLERTINRTK